MKSLRVLVPLLVVAAITTCADQPVEIPQNAFSTAVADSTTQDSTAGETVSADLTFSAADLQPEPETGLTVLPEGLAIDDAASQGLYTSEVISAPIPFNAVVPRWELAPFDAAGFELELRTSVDGENWTPWHDIHTQADWIRAEDEYQVGEMVFVPPGDQRHEYLQFGFSFSRDFDNETPVLEKLTFTFIDSTAGPTTEELVLQQAQLDASRPAIVEESVNASPKPSVISREIWCTDPRCNYTDGLEYEPVTHLILHHTVTPPGTDSAATMRSIWNYHANTLGWGDIGYNYLVDPDGVLYEGHAGGDDVIGIHSRDANAGSMALSMIGDFRFLDVTPELFESAVNLFAWKADQQNIDVFDASNTLPNISTGRPNLMGHRETVLSTVCPGDKGYFALPQIRDEVAARIGLVSPHIYIDELSDDFTRNGGTWRETNPICGHNSHSWYAWSTTSAAQSTNNGQWQLDVPASGRYEIEAYIPYCQTFQPETAGANYTVHHANGSSTVIVNQNAQVGLWASLGEFDLQAGSDNRVELTDLTTTDSGLGVWFDSLRLRSVEVQPAAGNVSPAEGAWLVDQEVDFSWTIENPDKVTTTRLQVARDDGFQDIAAQESWSGAVESATLAVNQDFDGYFWRVVVENDQGASFLSASSRFSIDSTAPVSAVISALFLPWTGHYYLEWTGADNLAGTASYSIETREVGQAGWNAWLSDVAQTSGLFVAPPVATDLEFRSQATDAAGNVEAAHETADKNSTEAISLSHAIILPAISAD